MVIRAKNSGFGVAGLPWNPWLVSYGITGWFGVESVAGFPWNRWLVWHGIRSASLVPRDDSCPAILDRTYAEWSEREDLALEAAFLNGMTIKNLSLSHGRAKKKIKKRLKKLALLVKKTL